MSSAFVKKAEDISSSFLRVLFALNVFFQTSDLFINVMGQSTKGCADIALRVDLLQIPHTVKLLL